MVCESKEHGELSVKNMAQWISSLLSGLIGFFVWLAVLGGRKLEKLINVGRSLV